MNEQNIDYAPFMIQTKQLMESMRKSFVKGEYDKAVALGDEAVVELRLTVLAMKHERDKHNLRE